MIAVADVRKAGRRIRGVAHRTPLVQAKFADSNIFFKCENLQRGGAFKFRGAYNAISSLSPA